MKRYGNIFISMTILIALVVPNHSLQAESKLNDIFAHWAEQSIGWAVDQKIVQGFEDGSFKPDKTVTEAEFIAMFIRLFPNSNEKNNDLLKNVQSLQDWTETYYRLSSDMEFNISNRGDLDYAYRNLPINRGLVAQIIAGAAGIDYSVEESIAYLYDNGLSSGKIDKTLNGFDPDALLTRAEAVQFFKLMADKSFTKQLIKRQPVSHPSINVNKYNIVTNQNKRPGHPTIEDVKAVLEKYHYDLGRYYDSNGHRGFTPCYLGVESGSQKRMCLVISFDSSFDSFNMGIYSSEIFKQNVDGKEEVQFAEFVKEVMELYGFPTTDSTIEDIKVPTFAGRNLDPSNPEFLKDRQDIINEVDFWNKPYGDGVYASFSHNYFGGFVLRNYKMNVDENDPGIKY